MDALMAWVAGDGAPPWKGLVASDAIHALESTRARLLEAIEVGKRLGAKFKWASFELLERSWGDFDAVHRLCHASAFLSFPDFAAAKDLADQFYRELVGAWTGSRSLRRGVDHLRKNPTLAKWQARALDRSGIGAAGYERQADRERRGLRAAMVSRLEKECAKNVSTSIELSFVWTECRKELSGLPSWLIDTARERAKAKHWKGWIFYANYREYRCFMAHADHRELRRRMYQARSKAGSEYVSGCDNAQLAKKILAARKEEASECGFETYAQYCLSDHMVKTADEVEQLLLDHAGAATSSAVVERASLDAWMKATHEVARLEPWDYRYARASLEREACSGSMEDSSRYFSPTRTIERCVAAVAEFLGVGYKRQRAAEREDLMVYEIISPQGFSGYITIAQGARALEQDMVAFEWTIACRAHTRPVSPSTLIMLQMERSGGRLVNLTHRDVVTLFHELGHAFHAVLGAGRTLTEAPTSIEADALEMHSQLIEMLAWEPAILMEIGRSKGRRMPKIMAESLASMRNFHAGSWTISQVTDALCDIRLHHDFNPRGRLMPWEVMVAIKKEVGLDTPKSYNRQAQQLGAFTGSYVCGDYAYLWSEGLARKIFDKCWSEAKGRKKDAARSFLRESIFDQGARTPTAAQVRRYVGSTPDSSWLALARGFK